MRLVGSVRIVAVVAALCLLCVALATWTLLQTRTAAIAEGMRRVEGVALVLEQQADQMIAAVEQMLDLAAAAVADAGSSEAGPPHAEDLAPVVAGGWQRLPQLRAVYFVDARGWRHPIGTDANEAGVDVSERRFFQNHRRDRSLALRIVEPGDRTSEDARHLFLSRRLDASDGSFAGVLLAELDLDYLRRLYGRIQLTENSSIGMVTMAGRLVVRIPDTETYAGRDFSRNLQQRPEGATAGALSLVSPVDGVVRLLGYRILSEYPLMVYASSPRDEVLADWRASSIFYVAFTGMLLAALCMLSFQTVREVRQRRMAEQSVRDSMDGLQRQKALVDAILNALPDGTQLFDTRQRMVGWNDRLFSILKVDRDDVFAAPDPTHRFFEILTERGEYGPGDTEALIQSRLDITRASERFEYRRQLVDGRWMECRGEPIAGLGLLAVYRDITSEVEREGRMRAIQTSLEDARFDAERANRAKTEFLAGMSHELRTPLNAILGFSEVIGGLYFGRDVIDRYAEYGDDIHKSATHLLSLIDSLLDLAKIEAGKMELSEETVEVDECVERAVAMCRPVAAGKGVAMSVSVGTGAALRADRQKLVQSLLNVVSNAIKFTPSGGHVAISARIEARGLVLQVVDDGIGIAAADIPKVFEAFRQVHSDPAMNAKGTGLGMPLTKRLIELHGGMVDIVSAPGEGTTATIALPAERLVEPAIA